MSLMPRPGVEKAPLYVPGSHKLEGIAEPAILSANENPLGPSPKAREAYIQAAAELNRYPEGGSLIIREALAARFGLDPARLVCGAGSDELITLLTRALVGPGDEVLYSRHGFPMYLINALQAGATPVTAPETNLTADVDALLKRVTEKTRILFLANPNNPTGTYLPASEVARLAAGLPERVLLALDAAYAEYVSRDDYAAGIELVNNHSNVVMLRTFSKAFGLAALRLGWCYAPPKIAEWLMRLRNPFNVNLPAQHAGVAAVADSAHIERSCAHNDRWLAELSTAVGAMGLAVTPSVANFLLIGFPDLQTTECADRFLKQNGVIVRAMTGAGLPSHLRVTVGLEWENRLFLKALQEFQAAA